MKMKQKLIVTSILLLFSVGMVVLSGGGVALAQVDLDPYAGDTERGINQESSDRSNSNGADLARCDDESENCCGDVATSIIGCPDSAEQEEGGVIFWLLKWVLRIMTAGVGIAAVGGIAYGALLYTTAENKPEQTKKAISVITNVVIGIVAYALMAVFLNFLIPGGIFS